MYKLKKTSLLAKFYSWIWKTDVSNFKTMCPYFWKYVLTIIFIIPILLGKLLSYAYNSFFKKKIVIKSKGCEKIYNNVFVKPIKFWFYFEKISKWIFISLLGFCIIIMIIALSYRAYKHPINALAIIGAVSLILCAAYGLGYLFIETNIIKILWSPFKLLGNMIYSLYKNMCPMIKWED